MNEHLQLPFFSPQLKKRYDSFVELKKKCTFAPTWEVLANIMSIITHDGIVESIDGNLLRIRITQLPSCASCQAANRCRASESKEKIVDICLGEDMATGKQNEGKPYEVGDHVVLKAQGSVGLRAVALAFVIPFIVVVTVLFVAFGLTNSELPSALLGLGSLVVYYIFLYLLRDRIRQKLQFVVEHKNMD